jgi:hypothetical protein
LKEENGEDCEKDYSSGPTVLGGSFAQTV